MKGILKIKKVRPERKTRASRKSVRHASDFPDYYFKRTNADLFRSDWTPAPSHRIQEEPPNVYGLLDAA